MKNQQFPDGVDKSITDDNVNVNAITFNFRSPDYTAEYGGYYPVEICIERCGDTWQLSYITDFKYFGQGHCIELAKNTDFDFSHDEFRSVFGITPLSDAAEFYPLWEANFLEYVINLEVFQLTITCND